MHPEYEYDTIFKNKLFKNKLFKTTNKYDLWLRDNNLTNVRLYHYDQKYSDEILSELMYYEYDNDDFDYSLVTPEQKVDILIEFVIDQLEEENGYEFYYWVELG